MAKIFVRERGSVGPGDGRPRYAIVGVEGTDLKVFKTHVRKSELEAISQAVGAELVYLPAGTGEHAGEGHGQRRHRRSRRGAGGDAASA